MDNILFFLPSIDAHKKHFHVATQYSLKAKRSEWAFKLESFECLKHIVSKDGVWIYLTKIHAIADYLAPIYIRDLCILLGMKNYYSKLID